MNNVITDKRVSSYFSTLFKRIFQKAEKDLVDYVSIDGADEHCHNILIYWTPNEQSFLSPITISGVQVHAIQKIVCNEENWKFWPGGWTDPEEVEEGEEIVRLPEEWKDGRGPDFLETIEIPDNVTAVKVEAKGYINTEFGRDKNSFSFTYTVKAIIMNEGSLEDLYKALGIDHFTINTNNEKKYRKELNKSFQDMSKDGMALDEIVLDELRLFKISQVQE